MHFTRRELLKTAAAVSAAPSLLRAQPRPASAQVYVVRAADRAKAVAACLEAAAFTACKDKRVALKANFNSDDAFPASTHPDTLRALVSGLKARGATGIDFAERSGMGDTAAVLENTGARKLLRDAGATVTVLDAAPKEAWRAFKADHWPNGFYAARLFTDAECAVHTMCCKTHRFGGHVTLSLKDTIGLVAKRVPGIDHDFMRDLHGSPHQRRMIAEANLAWRPALNVMDCLEAFTDGGPDRGTKVAPGVFLCSGDRCALDAAAIALLRLHGLKGPTAQGLIGQTEQLARAIELGVGAAPKDVELIATTADAKDVASRMRDVLAKG